MIIRQKIGISLLVAFLAIFGMQAQRATFLRSITVPRVTCENVITCVSNVASDKNEKVENFKENDKQGWGMAVTSVAIVFLGLIFLYLFFKITGNIAVMLSRKRVMKASGLSKEEARNAVSESGEIYAAIAMAIYETTEEDQHDDENTVLTIKNVARNYSPWSSKIYGLRELPKK